MSTSKGVFMTAHIKIAIWCTLLLLPLLVLPRRATAQEKGSDARGLCSQSQTEQLCAVTNTCGSPSSSCTVDVKRTANSAEVTADIAEKKGNALFCVKKGTKVTWQSSSKNIGFVVDVGPSFPFEPGESIIGGSDRPVVVVAAKTGCYSYSAGACASGVRYGMCKTVEGEIIISD